MSIASIRVHFHDFRVYFQAVGAHRVYLFSLFVSIRCFALVDLVKISIFCASSGSARNIFVSIVSIVSIFVCPCLFFYIFHRFRSTFIGIFRVYRVYPCLTCLSLTFSCLSCLSLVRVYFSVSIVSIFDCFFQLSCLFVSIRVYRVYFLRFSYFSPCLSFFSCNRAETYAKKK